MGRAVIQFRAPLRRPIKAPHLFLDETEMMKNKIKERILLGKIFYEEEYISEIESYLYKTEIYQDNKTHNFSLESVDKEYIDDIYNELISKIS